MSDNLITKNTYSINKNLNKIKPYDKSELKKYFDPDIYEQLPNLTFNEISPRQLIIVFWDISGFSDFCNVYKDEQQFPVAFLKNFFQDANSIIKQNEGILDKFLGDGLLAYFGLNKISGVMNTGPEKNKSEIKKSTKQAIKSAIELRKKFKKINESHYQIWTETKRDKINMGLKCAIHIETVLFGILETGERKQITIFGRGANFCSRLVEEIAENDEIIISDDLKKYMKKTYSCSTLKVEERIKSKLKRKNKKYRIKSFEDVETFNKLTNPI